MRYIQCGFCKLHFFSNFSVLWIFCTYIHNWHAWRFVQQSWTLFFLTSINNSIGTCLIIILLLFCLFSCLVLVRFYLARFGKFGKFRFGQCSGPNFCWTLVRSSVLFGKKLEVWEVQSSDLANVQGRTFLNIEFELRTVG